MEKTPRAVHMVWANELQFDQNQSHFLTAILRFFFSLASRQPKQQKNVRENLK